MQAGLVMAAKFGQGTARMKERLTLEKRKDTLGGVDESIDKYMDMG